MLSDSSYVSLDSLHTCSPERAGLYDALDSEASFALQEKVAQIR